MAKQKAKFYEELEFDDVQYALDVYNGYKRKHAKMKNALYIAIVATLCNLYGLIPIVMEEATTMQSFIGGIGILLAIIAYVIGGGILSALKCAWKVAKFVWFVCVFPWDLFFSAIALCFSSVCFFGVPVIFVYMNYRQAKADYDAACRYIRCFKAKQQSESERSYSNQNRIASNQSYTQNNPNRMTGSQLGTSSSQYRTTTSRPRTQTGQYRTTTGQYRTAGQSYQSRNLSNQSWR